MEKIDADGWRFSDIQDLKSHLVDVLDGVDQELLDSIQCIDSPSQLGIVIAAVKDCLEERRERIEEYKEFITETQEKIIPYLSWVIYTEDEINKMVKERRAFLKTNKIIGKYLSDLRNAQTIEKQSCV